MKKKYKIALLVLSIVIIGLIVFNKRRNDEKVHVLSEYNSGGKLTGTNQYIIRNGDTVLQGKFVKYNDDGIKIAEGKFDNNEPIGVSTFYYDNGKIKSLYYRKNSEVNLECTYYNQEGIIDKYIMCDSVGNTRFIIKFENKIVKKYDGYSILPIGLYKIENKKQYEIKKGDVLKVGDVIKHSYLVANIPNAKRTFRVENVNADNSAVNRVIKSELPAEIIINEVLTKKGINKINIIAQYTFDDKVTPTLKKVVSFDINVD